MVAMAPTASRITVRPPGLPGTGQPCPSTGKNATVVLERLTEPISAHGVGGHDQDVSDELWAAVAPLLPPEPPKPKGGRPRCCDRRALEGIVFVLWSEHRWERLPREAFLHGRDLLAPIAGLARRRRAGSSAPGASRAARRGGRARLGQGLDRQRLVPRIEIGPNPTDRGPGHEAASRLSTPRARSGLTATTDARRRPAPAPRVPADARAPRTRPPAGAYVASRPHARRWPRLIASVARPPLRASPRHPLGRSYLGVLREIVIIHDLKRDCAQGRA